MPWLFWVSGELCPPAATEAEQSSAAGGMEVLPVMPAAFPSCFCWCLGKRGGCLRSVLGTAGGDAAEPPHPGPVVPDPSSACLRRGPHRCKYERDHDGGYPPVLRKGPFHQAGRPLEAERLFASLEGNRGAPCPCRAWRDLGGWWDDVNWSCSAEMFLSNEYKDAGSVALRCLGENRWSQGLF